MKLPEIVGETWFNLPAHSESEDSSESKTGRQGSKALTKEDLQNKVVLVDFWTYSCVNCVRTIPYLRNWWAKYKDKDLLIIGIHTPEFEFEKDPKNVEKALKELGVSWSVVMDNDYANWNNFANHYWPAKYMANKAGNIVYEHFGEGGYLDTEKKIQELLGKSDQEQMPKVETDEHHHGAVCFIPTPETYCGYLRGVIENLGGYYKDSVFDYQKPEQLPDNSIALSGKFLAKSEYVESRDPDARLYLHFKATEVNLVASPVEPQATVEITLDGKPLADDIKGHDINNNKVIIRESKMYNLLKTKDFLAGIIGIKSVAGNFRAYAFTFSGCVD